MGGFAEIGGEVARKGEKMEENKAMKETAQLLVKKAWITEELYAPIAYCVINDFFKKPLEHSDLFSHLGVSYECGRKTFSPYNSWVITLRYIPVIKGAEIWLSVNSENCKDTIVLSARGIQPYWERLLEILMKFEDSWQEKAEFIWDSLRDFNRKVESENPVLIKILDQSAEKIMAHYDEIERAEEKLKALEEKNKEMTERRVGYLRFLRETSEKLEETKRWFKSKKIAEIRENIEKKITELLEEGEDAELLKSWTESWAANKAKELNSK